jgi:hypothetical protein
MRQQGAIVLNGREVADTRQCCHCGQHFVSVKGSGTIRGFCRCCMAVTCGAAACDVCVPMERQLELMERRAV